MSKSTQGQAKQAPDQEQEVGKHAMRLANAVVLPMVLKSALELNIIDSISAAAGDDGMFFSPLELASQLPTKNPDAPLLLDRMLRLLASYDFVKCSLRTNENGETERLYGAQPICKFLALNQDGASVGPLFLLLHDKVSMESWYHLYDAILEGGIPFHRAYGMKSFEYLGTDQRYNNVFNKAMSNQTTMVMKKLLDVYTEFQGVNVLVDVAGGIGVTLNAIISKYPLIKGINFDLPHVIANASFYPDVEHRRGDMFSSVPEADAIFMKWILHDWSDEDCLRILKNCWKALPNNGKVIIVESILAEAPANSISSQIPFELDLVMLVQTSGGKERTQKEFEALAMQSGFSSCEVVCCAYNNWVMEFIRS